MVGIVVVGHDAVAGRSCCDEMLSCNISSSFYLFLSVASWH